MKVRMLNVTGIHSVSGFCVNIKKVELGGGGVERHER